MEYILSQLDKVAEEVKGLEEKRRMLGQFLREITGVEIRSKEVLEKKISFPVKRSDLKDAKIIGVDGGLVRQAYHAVDLILTRSVGVAFIFKNGKLDKVDYYPNAFPSPQLTVITDSHSLQDLMLTASLERQQSEVKMLTEMGDLGGDLVLADGSIVPHPMDRPKNSSPLFRRYERLLELYRGLYSTKMLLAGVNEDSRSKRVTDILSESILAQIKDARVEQLSAILKSTRDSNLLFHVLKEGERSFVFRYSEESQIIKDLGDVAKNVYSFYMKTTSFDRPIRVDFYSEKDPVNDADKIASLLFPISSHNQEYGFPTVLVEADSKARLREEELDVVHSYIVDKVGSISALYKLRRDSRPF